MSAVRDACTLTLEHGVRLHAAPVSFVDIERSVAGMESDVERVAQFLERERVAVAELEVRGDQR